MIVKSQAQEPKVSSATSVYPAVITNIKDPDPNSMFIYLQIYCPDVMSGTPVDARYALNNWVDAPKKPHLGNVTYSYVVGGVIMVSYQNGNVNCPQFVRWVEADDYVIELNRRYVEGASDIRRESGMFNNIMDSTVNLSTPGIAKGASLLPALEAMGKKDINYSTYGVDKLAMGSNRKGEAALSIWICGWFNTEIIYKHTGNVPANYREAYANLLENVKYPFPKILQYLMEVEDTSSDSSCLVGLINKAIIEFERKEDYAKAMYSKTSMADKVFWYTNLAGYTWSPLEKDNMSTKIAPGYVAMLTTPAEEEGGKSTTEYPSVPDKGSDTKLVVCYEDASTIPDLNMYDFLFRWMHNYRDAKQYWQNRADFVDEVWDQICESSFFYEKLSSRYAMILSNNLFDLKSTYNVETLSNRTLLVLTVLSTGWMSLEHIFFDLTGSKSKYGGNCSKFIESIMNGLLDENKEISASDWAEGITELYFENLEWDPEKDDFDFENYPDSAIANKTKAAVSWIYDNYDNLKNIMTQNEGTNISASDGATGVITGSGQPSSYGLVWPFPGVKHISSPYGMRTHPISGERKMHTGIDISESGCGDKDIIAAAAGKATKVVYNNSSSGYGNYIIITHETGGLSTLYAHLRRPSINQGDTVVQGQVIGKCDSTGSSTGNHLHFEVRVNGKHQNPTNYVSSTNTVNASTAGSSSSSGGVSGGSSSGKYYDCPLSHDVQNHLFTQCKKYGLPSALMIALIQTESNFKADVVNSKKCYGLCQIKESNHDWLRQTLGISNFLDPKDNITAGCYMLSLHTANYGTDDAGLHKSLMAYNMGAAGARGQWSRGVYQSGYSQKIMERYAVWRKAGIA